MKIEPGIQVGPYKIVAPLGAGGMGEVFVAEDTRLGRKVALKALPVEMAADPERRARFEREARAVAALNHPNIVTLHSVEEENGAQFITMELVEGEGLSERIPKGGMSLGKLFDVAIPLADALASAHKQGITHRDLKPNNIMITPEGRVKVLDFGLAKLGMEVGGGAGGAHMPTATVTREGKILGTVSYMSPEQAEGKPVDPRSDVFSLGVLLYEMTTGLRPFEGDTPVSTITSIMRDEPVSITELNGTLPRHLGRIIRRCLNKDPDRRYQSAVGLRNELEQLKTEVDSGELDAPTTAAAGVVANAGASAVAGTHPGAKPARRFKKRWIALAAMIVVAVALVGLGYGMRGGGNAFPAAAAAPVQARYTQLTSSAGREMFPSIAPDGKSFLYTGNGGGDGDIFLQRVGGDRPLNLTEDSPAHDFMAVFSPDGEHIAFVSDRDGHGIYLMGSMGSSVRRVTEFGYNPTWSPDGTRIAFAEEPIFEPRNRNVTSPLWIVDVESGETRKVAEGDAVQPSWSPDGTRIACWGTFGKTAQRDLVTIDVESGEAVKLTDDKPVDWNPAWSPDGGQLYFSSDRGGVLNLWRIPVDPRSGLARGEPVPITTPAGWVGGISVSRDGSKVVYSDLEIRTRIETVDLDPSKARLTGSPRKIFGGSRQVRDLAISPDGEWVAFPLTGTQEDICVVRHDGTGFRQLTDDPAKDRGVSWTPDGRIAFYSNRSGGYEAWTIRPDGSGLSQLTSDSPHPVWFPQISPDGSRLIYVNASGSFITEVGAGADTERVALPSPLGEIGRAWTVGWTQDGKSILATAIVESDRDQGIFLYSVEGGTYKHLVDGGDSPALLGPSTLLYRDQESDLPMVLDLGSGRTRAMETGGMDTSDWKEIRVAPGGMALVYMVREEESDVWMAELQ